MTEDLRKLEARMDARFQGVNARFSTVDRRHDSLRGRLDITEAQWQDFREWVEHRVETNGDRDDETDHRIDLVYDCLAAKIDQAAKRRGRVLLYVAGVTGTTAAVVAAVVAVLLS